MSISLKEKPEILSNQKTRRLESEVESYWGSCTAVDWAIIHTYKDRYQIFGLSQMRKIDIQVLYHFNQFVRPLSRALWTWTKSVVCPLSQLKRSEFQP